MEEKHKCPICRRDLNKTPKNIGHNDYLKVDCAYCGEYELKGHVLRGRYYKDSSLNLHDKEPDYDLSIAIRHYPRKENEILVLSSTNIDEVRKSVYIPSDRFYLIDLLLKYCNEHMDLTQSGCIIPETDMPLLYIRNTNALSRILEFGQLIDYIDSVIKDKNGYGFSPSADGWRRIKELGSSSKDSDTVFVAMRFGKADINKLYSEAIVPAIKACNYHPVLANDPPTLGKICDKILSDIRHCAFVIADFTHQNQGVYFEAGFALALGKPVVWCCKEKDVEKLHFDTRQYNHILWKNEEDLKKQLIDRIGATIGTR